MTLNLLQDIAKFYKSCTSFWHWWAKDEASEAVALLKELGSEHLLQPTSVLIEQRKPDNYQLCVKGNYNRQEIEDFLLKYTFAFEEDARKGLCIFKP